MRLFEMLGGRPRRKPLDILQQSKEARALTRGEYSLFLSRSHAYFSALRQGKAL